MRPSVVLPVVAALLPAPALAQMGDDISVEQQDESASENGSAETCTGNDRRSASPDSSRQSNVHHCSAHGRALWAI